MISYNIFTQLTWYIRRSIEAARDTSAWMLKCLERSGQRQPAIHQLLFSGLRAQVCHGGIYCRTMAIRAIRTAVLSASATRASAKHYWKCWLTIRIAKGWWSMPVIVRFIHMLPESEAGIRTWVAHKRGLNTTIYLTVDVCAWHAGQSFYYTRYHTADAHRLVAWSKGLMRIIY